MAGLELEGEETEGLSREKCVEQMGSRLEALANAAKAAHAAIEANAAMVAKEREGNAEKVEECAEGRRL